MSGGAIIEFRAVHKAFGANVVCRAMDLQVFEGEVLAIIGGSGQGKSVCLKLMIGLLRADSGAITYRGREVGALDSEGLRRLRRDVAYVFQLGALFDSMTVGENVGYALREHTKLGDAEIRARVVECLQLVNLDVDLIDRVPASLSGGMKKRVALARSIAIQPEVILYDEPTTGLDPTNTTRIAEMIQKLQRELKVTSVVVTHDMPTAFAIADRIAMLYDKHFPFIGRPEEFRHHPSREVRDFVLGHVDEAPPPSASMIRGVARRRPPQGGLHHGLP